MNFEIPGKNTVKYERYPERWRIQSRPYRFAHYEKNPVVTNKNTRCMLCDTKLNRKINYDDSEEEEDNDYIFWSELYCDSCLVYKKYEGIKPNHGIIATTRGVKENPRCNYCHDSITPNRCICIRCELLPEKEIEIIERNICKELLLYYVYIGIEAKSRYCLDKLIQRDATDLTKQIMFDKTNDVYNQFIKQDKKCCVCSDVFCLSDDYLESMTIVDECNNRNEFGDFRIVCYHCLYIHKWDFKRISDPKNKMYYNPSHVRWI